MKRDQSSVEHRRSQILKKIREEEEVKVEDLAQEFGLSCMTVRRDLQYLEDRNLVTRFYGGATVNPEYRCASAEEELALYRRQLSRYAATKVLNGETLFINGSMAALGILDYITAHNPDASILFMLNTDLRAEIADGLTAACAHYGVKLLCLQEISKQNGHPDVAGMKQIAEQTSSALDAF